MVTILVAGIDLSLQVRADDMDGGQGSMKIGNQEQIRDRLIRRVDIKGYTFEYRLIDKRHSMPDSSPGMYHLSVIIVDSKGKKIDNAVVKFEVKGPNGVEQSVNGVAINSEFERNIKFEFPGIYEIKTTVVTGRKRMVDIFESRVEEFIPTPDP
jgi:hypothetical protein